MRDTIDMAREAGLNVGPAGMGQTVWGGDENLKAFEALVRADERALAAPVQEPIDSMGMPLSCGKPLCAPGDHHPLCKLATPPSAQPAVPEGWRLVPVKPTPEMLDAGVADLRLRGYDRALIVAAIECYGAMLAAAPTKGKP